MITGKSVCGNVEITCNGKFEFTTVKMNEAWAQAASAAELQAKTLEALQDITRQIMGLTESKMKELTQGINIPGLKLPF
jgi:nucleoid-associated protein EbfC